MKVVEGETVKNFTGYCVGVVWLTLIVLPASSMAAVPTHHNLAALEAQAQQFVQNEWANTPHRIEFGKLDSKLKVANCPAPQIEWLNKKRSGSTAVVLRCDSPSWSLRLPVVVEPNLMIVVSKRALSAGEVLRAEDLELKPAPAGYNAQRAMLNVRDAVGKVVTFSMAAGLPLRPEHLKGQQVIRAGQKVRVLAQDVGFSVSAEGVATRAAMVGEVVVVKMQGGRTVSGVAQADGSVLITL